MNGTIMTTFSVWECIICGWIYDESQGFPEDGIAPGTLWDDIPQDWTCPDCGVTKQDFEMVKTGLSAIATKVTTPEEKPRLPKACLKQFPWLIIQESRSKFGNVLSAAGYTTNPKVGLMTAF
jgi:rubredoxin